MLHVRLLLGGDGVHHPNVGRLVLLGKVLPNSVSFAYPGAAAAAPALGAFAQAAPAPKPSAFASARFGASAASTPAAANAGGQAQSHLCKTLPHLCATGARAPAAAAAPHQFGPEFAQRYVNGPGAPGVQQPQLQPQMATAS